MLPVVAQQTFVQPVIVEPEVRVAVQDGESRRASSLRIGQVSWEALWSLASLVLLAGAFGVFLLIVDQAAGAALAPQGTAVRTASVPIDAAGRKEQAYTAGQQDRA